MGKHLRDYRRLAMRPGTGKVLARISRLTFDDHKKCDESPCRHEENGNLAVAWLLQERLTIGKKRAYLDLPDPYSTDDHEAAGKVLRNLAARIEAFSGQEKTQTTKALVRVSEETLAFADRSPLEVIAEAALHRKKD